MFLPKGRGVPSRRGWMKEELCFDSWYRQANFICSETSRLALGSTGFHIQ